MQNLRITGVEKNPYAVNTLHNMVIEEDMKNVTILSGDMRSVAPEREAQLRADVIVSELLGSFGDNELSPECLYPTERFAHEATIYIPAYYRAQFRPMSSQNLWGEVKQFPVGKGECPFEIGYVVCIFGASYPCGEKIETAFEFWHPSEDKSSKRETHARFKAERDGWITGFAGYFETQLYGDVWLSTNPRTHTEDMHSWFPIYFPVKVRIDALRSDDIAAGAIFCREGRLDDDPHVAMPGGKQNMVRMVHGGNKGERQKGSSNGDPQRQRKVLLDRITHLIGTPQTKFMLESLENT